MMNTTINIRIEEGIIKKLREEQVNISEIVRKALIVEAEKNRREKLKIAIKNAKGSLGLKQNEIVSMVREMRETR